jgi:hypothetical protein
VEVAICYIADPFCVFLFLYLPHNFLLVTSKTFVGQNDNPELCHSGVIRPRIPIDCGSFMLKRLESKLPVSSLDRPFLVV